MTARAGDAAPSGPPAVIRESLQGQVRRFRVAVYRLRRGHGGQSRRVPARPGRHLVRGQGADRHGHHLAQGRHLGDHRLCGLGVHLLRLFLGRQRQDRRHGAVRRAGRARRRHRRKRAPGGRAHAGAPAELPVPGTGVRRASCWGTGAGRCTTSSPGRRSSTRGTRGRRGCGSCPGADPAAASSAGSRDYGASRGLAVVARRSRAVRSSTGQRLSHDPGLTAIRAISGHARHPAPTGRRRGSRGPSPGQPGDRACAGRPVPAVPGVPAWAQSAFSIATRMPSGLTSRAGTLTSRTPLS